MLTRFVPSRVVTLEPREADGALDTPSTAGLMDRLIHARQRALGALKLTFERKLAALEGAVRLRGN